MLKSRVFIQNYRFRNLLELTRNKIFRLKARLLDLKRDFSIGNKIFRLETEFLDWKQDF